MNCLIRNTTVLTMNEQNEILNDADVLVKDGIIAKVGRNIAYTGNAEVIDGQGKLLMPGLINCHCHVPMTVLRSYADDMELQTWLFNHIFPVEARLT